MSFIKSIDKKLLTMIGLVLGLIAILIVAIVLVSLSSGGVVKFSKIEEKLESAAKSYFKDNDAKLPKNVGEESSVEISELVSGGYIKDLSEMTKEGVSCSGLVYVGKTEEDYDYVAKLDCGSDYKTEFLSDKLIATAVTSGSGLYKMEDIVKPGSSTLDIDDTGYDLSKNEVLSGYVYKGQKIDNYIKIDDEIFRIMQVDGKNDIHVFNLGTKARSTYDNRYNEEVKRNYGITKYEVSRAYEKLEDVYKKLENKSIIKQKGVSKNICIGERGKDEDSTDGSVECAKVLKNQKIGLIPMYQLMNASASDECISSDAKACTNYNYMVDGKAFWTLTPFDENTYQAYYIGEDIKIKNANTSTTLKYVYYLSHRVKYDGGTGTYNDPYTIK